MKKIIAGIILPLLVISFTSLTSCKDRAAAKQQKKAELERVKTIDNQIEANVYPLPTSVSVIKMLTQLEVGYIIGISNPVENTKKYFSSSTLGFCVDWFAPTHMERLVSVDGSKGP